MIEPEARDSILAAIEAEVKFLVREHGCDPADLLNQIESIVEELRDKFDEPE